MAQISFEKLHRKVLMLDETPAKIVNIAGTDIHDYNVMEGFRRALNSSYHDEQPSQSKEGLPFAKKMERYEISKKIFNSDDKGVELNIDELKELKVCIGKLFNGEALGFLVDIIEDK